MSINILRYVLQERQLILLSITLIISVNINDLRKLSRPGSKKHIASPSKLNKAYSGS